MFKKKLFDKRIKKRKSLNKKFLNLLITINIKLLKIFIIFKYIINPLILIEIKADFKILIYIFNDIQIETLLKLAKKIKL